jgi:pyruvate/2-oxoglutarate/acetoin dehydrogenase E1 component
MFDIAKKNGYTMSVYRTKSLFHGISQVRERAFYFLQSPVLRVSGFDVPFPPANLEGVFLPDVDRILDAVDRARGY